MQVYIPWCLLETQRFNQLQALVELCMCLYLRRCSPCWTFQPWHGKAIPRKNWSCRHRGLEGNEHWGLGQVDGKEVHVNHLSIVCKSRKIGFRCYCHLPEICAKRAGVVWKIFLPGRMRENLTLDQYFKLSWRQPSDVLTFDGETPCSILEPKDCSDRIDTTPELQNVIVLFLRWAPSRGFGTDIQPRRLSTSWTSTQAHLDVV